MGGQVLVPVAVGQVQAYGPVAWQEQEHYLYWQETTLFIDHTIMFDLILLLLLSKIVHLSYLSGLLK